MGRGWWTRLAWDVGRGTWDVGCGTWGVGPGRAEEEEEKET